MYSQEALKQITRRNFFKQAGFSLGAMALASLLDEKAFAQGSDPFAPKPSHFAPRAKNIIYLFMAGAPSQIDLFDHKPALNRYDGKNIPEEMIRGERFAFIKGVPKLLGSPYSFKQYGDSGTELSTLLPHLSSVADDIAVIRSMDTDQFNHAPAQIFVNCG